MYISRNRRQRRRTLLERYGSQLGQIIERSRAETALVAAKQGHSELAIGNVAGSNLFNLLFVLGTTASIAE